MRVASETKFCGLSIEQAALRTFPSIGQAAISSWLRSPNLPACHSGAAFGVGQGDRTQTFGAVESSLRGQSCWLPHRPPARRRLSFLAGDRDRLFLGVPRPVVTRSLWLDTELIASPASPKAPMARLLPPMTPCVGRNNGGPQRPRGHQPCDPILVLVG